ncbi:hypothetical protein ScalyP_jg7821 [Parmales sp. scaly parma]|nr:hypothetical protein ScalyP_jg7821 [Parmales sp. scaly parma]
MAGRTLAARERGGKPPYELEQVFLGSATSRDTFSSFAIGLLLGQQSQFSCIPRRFSLELCTVLRSVLMRRSNYNCFSKTLAATLVSDTTLLKTSVTTAWTTKKRRKLSLLKSPDLHVQVHEKEGGENANPGL